MYLNNIERLIALIDCFLVGSILIIKIHCVYGEPVTVYILMQISLCSLWLNCPPLSLCFEKICQVPNEIEINLCVKQWAREKERHSKLHLTALDNGACSHQIHIDSLIKIPY